MSAPAYDEKPAEAYDKKEPDIEQAHTEGAIVDNTQSHALSRDLRSRHMQMIAIGMASQSNYSNLY
jgi:amino acid permease